MYRLIESPKIFSVFPLAPGDVKKQRFGRPVNIIHLVNYYSLKEKMGGARPPHWEMVFWWTRKPLIGARFVTIASLLPAEADVGRVARAIGLGSGKQPHRENPNLSIFEKQHREKIQESSLLDPFAGYGSIPLEAIRLGLREVAAVELLPTAYIFLKAILEYPKKYGASLVRDVEKWGEWITQKLREDPDLKELYDDDVAVYIGTWEVKCPHLDKYSPLIGNWWLARVRKGSQYTSLAYMKPRKTPDGNIEIEVVDLGKKHQTLANARVQGNTITINNHTYTVPEPNINAKTNTAYCLQDNKPINYIDPQTRKIYPEKQKAPRAVRKRLEFYPKWAIKQWNKLLEEYLEGKITLNQLLEKTPAKPTILVKVKIKNKTLEFHPATQQDTQTLWRALQKIQKIWRDPDIPTEPIPSYESRSIWVYPYGFDKWFKLFNPRQLLTLIKIVKLIREAGKKIEEEKIHEGWSKEKALNYAEAVTAYLAIALVKQADYNSIVIAWNPATGFGSALALLHAGHTLSFRGIAMSWNFVEYNFTVERVGYKKFVEMVIDGLSYIVSTVSGNPSRVGVLLEDATMLNNLGEAKFDAVVTDPPYHDDVPYAELSDFYYVWLKRALSDVVSLNGLARLAPRCLDDVCWDSPFYRRVGSGWKEIRTQWEEFARREVSVNPQRLGISRDEAIKLFEERLGLSFKKLANLLKDDSLLVTYYNHTSVDAWASLLRAGYEIAGLRVTSALPLVTESANRVTSRGKVRLDTSIIIAWRKRAGGKARSCLLGDARREALDEAKKFLKGIVGAGVVGYDILFAALGRVLKVLTSCSEIRTATRKLTTRDIAEEAYRLATRALAESLGEVAGVAINTAPARFYLITRVLFAEAGEIRLDGSAIGLLQIGVGVDKDDMVRLRILGRPKNNLFPLLYPLSDDKSSLRELLALRNLVPEPEDAELRSSIDVLHLLYYSSLLGASEFERAKEVLGARNRQFLEEALALARALCILLPDSDSEKKLACRIATGKVGAPRTLDHWT